MDKATLRAELRAQVAAVKPLQRALEEELVNAAIMGFPEWQQASTVLLYKHKGAEFSVNSLGNAAFRDGKRVCFPRVEDDGLSIRAIDAWTGLMPGEYGIDEPTADAQVVVPADVDVAVVPGLGWTKDGARLGQGGGYYDRLLPELRCSIGVGFDVQLRESLPLEPHDVPVARVVNAAQITGA